MTENMINLFKDKLAPFIIDNLTKVGISKYLTDTQVILIDYFLTFGKLPNLKNPETFTEKMQWLKIYGHLENYAKYVDKYKVRKYVEKRIGNKFLVPLLGVWDRFDDINFDKLPDKFVLKATHGSYYNFICKDKLLFDKNKLRKTFNKWLNRSFYNVTREIQYKNCKPKIICEKYLQDYSGGLIDYKFYCTHGRPRLVEIHTDRFLNHNVAMLDLNWRRLPFRFIPKTINPLKVVSKPKNIDEMLAISRKLSKPFPFVRVDLYSVNNKSYFSELTFTPASGLMKFERLEGDLQLGKIIDLKKFDKRFVE